MYKLKFIIGDLTRFTKVFHDMDFIPQIGSTIYLPYYGDGFEVSGIHHNLPDPNYPVATSMGHVIFLELNGDTADEYLVDIMKDFTDNYGWKKEDY